MGREREDHGGSYAIQKVVSLSDQAPPLSLVASLPLRDKLDQDQLSDDHRPRSSSAGASCARFLLLRPHEGACHHLPRPGGLPAGPLHHLLLSYMRGPTTPWRPASSPPAPPLPHEGACHHLPRRGGLPAGPCFLPPLPQEGPAMACLRHGASPFPFSPPSFPPSSSFSSSFSPLLPSLLCLGLGSSC